MKIVSLLTYFLYLSFFHQIPAHNTLNYSILRSSSMPQRVFFVCSRSTRHSLKICLCATSIAFIPTLSLSSSSSPFFSVYLNRTLLGFVAAIICIESIESQHWSIKIIAICRMTLSFVCLHVGVYTCMCVCDHWFSLSQVRLRFLWFFSALRCNSWEFS